MSEGEKGFTVKDRRAFSQDDSHPEEDQAPPEKEPREQADGSSDDQDRPGDQPDSQQTCEEPGPGGRCLPPVDFSALILSLSHAALMHMGKVPDPSTGQASVQLDLARHTIDTIALLKDKTTGNLTDDERRLMDSVLTDLRLTYVHESK